MRHLSALTSRLHFVHCGVSTIFQKRSARHYQFHWPDGWWIGIKIEKLENEKHYRSLKKNLLGDLGYGWMIDNILEHDSCKDLDEEYLREVLEGEHTDI